MKIGIVGCGAISGIYLQNITKTFKELEIVGVCDLIPERAKKAAEEYNLHIYKDMAEMFADSKVDIVLNLTRPYEHFDVSIKAIEAGKHVYTEKPLGATLEEGKKLTDAANAKGVRIGGAPDTFLGAGIQSCRKLIDDGYIGELVGATAFMTNHGHESWHPDPEFYYQFGGGPMLDMGPYYISAMVNLLGAVKSVVGMGKASFSTRTITSQPHFGKIVDVKVPTYTMGLLQFDSGAIGSIFTTFDVHAANVPIIEIYGSAGTLAVPDPNTFGGPIKLYRPEQREFTDTPLTFGYPENSRGLGLADMAKAITTNREHRTSNALLLHVLEVMTAIEKSATTGGTITIESKYRRTTPMVNATLAGVLD
ncbi:MAG: Gfo/Idh/MocA family oxidoreductase [Defluviitaleaceae bacterium]|nr:Gfo/Idh/MocA family oxidoreductase [Defluviitaleaceae bacterium]